MQLVAVVVKKILLQIVELGVSHAPRHSIDHLLQPHLLICLNSSHQGVK